MFRNFLQRLLGLFFICQTVFMFIQNHNSSHPAFRKVLVLEALIFLLLSPWFLKTSWLTSLTLMIIGVTSILAMENFTFIQSYYPYIIFFPALVGITIIIVSYVKKPKS